MMFDYFDTDNSGALDTEVIEMLGIGAQEINWDDYGFISFGGGEAWSFGRSWPRWKWMYLVLIVLISVQEVSHVLI